MNNRTIIPPTIITSPIQTSVRPAVNMLALVAVRPKTKPMILHSISGGAAVHRCDKWLGLSAGLQVAEKLALRIRVCLQAYRKWS